LAARLGWRSFRSTSKANTALVTIRAPSPFCWAIGQAGL
jgi:hypothetical protein